MRRSVFWGRTHNRHIGAVKRVECLSMPKITRALSNVRTNNRLIRRHLIMGQRGGFGERSNKSEKKKFKKQRFFSLIFLVCWFLLLFAAKKLKNLIRFQVQTEERRKVWKKFLPRGAVVWSLSARCWNLRLQFRWLLSIFTYNSRAASIVNGRQNTSSKAHTVKYVKKLVPPKDTFPADIYVPVLQRLLPIEAAAAKNFFRDNLKYKKIVYYTTRASARSTDAKQRREKVEQNRDRLCRVRVARSQIKAT